MLVKRDNEAAAARFSVVVLDEDRVTVVGQDVCDLLADGSQQSASAQKKSYFSRSPPGIGLRLRSAALS